MWSGVCVCVVCGVWSSVCVWVVSVGVWSGVGVWTATQFAVGYTLTYSVHSGTLGYVYAIVLK